MAIVNGILGARDVMGLIRARGPAEEGAQLSASSRLESRLAGVVVSALREAFDRDHQRLAIERERMEAERERAERALRLELLRQAGERELSRLRLLTAVAVVVGLGSLVIATPLAAGSGLVRATFGVGVLLLLAAGAATCGAQTHVGRVLAHLDSRTHADELTATAAGAAASWLIVGGFAVITVAVLFG